MLKQSFFKRNTVNVARDLLGKYMVFGKKKIMITETEAYHGYEDKANHGSKGRTKRNSSMFDTVGHTYIYIIYGMYNMLNITTVEEGFPAGVLIRGGYDPVTKIHLKGPGIVTKYLGINRTLNGIPVYTKERLWFEDTNYHFEVKTGKRIGIDYAGKSRDLLWRFYIETNEINMVNWE